MPSRRDLLRAGATGLIASVAGCTGLLEDKSSQFAIGKSNVPSKWLPWPDKSEDDPDQNGKGRPPVSFDFVDYEQIRLIRSKIESEVSVTYNPEGVSLPFEYANFALDFTVQPHVAYGRVLGVTKDRSYFESQLSKEGTGFAKQGSHAGFTLFQGTRDVAVGDNHLVFGPKRPTPNSIDRGLKRLLETYTGSALRALSKSEALKTGLQRSGKVVSAYGVASNTYLEVDVDGLLARVSNVIENNGTTKMLVLAIFDKEKGTPNESAIQESRNAMATALPWSPQEISFTIEENIVTFEATMASTEYWQAIN